ncbi:hypothetical protein DOY81_003687 [Sarcophaga bullata]|nr:hypothetical protein DOY81_003687 [Sarcophaga bullata]
MSIAKEISTGGEEVVTLNNEIQEFLERDVRDIHEKLDSELPQELRFQIKNVLTVIETAIDKLKISLILPMIFENPKVLHRYLENTKYKDCLKLVDAYRQKRSRESLKDPDCKDYELLQVIEYFQENAKILDFMPNWLDDIEFTEKKMIKAFQDVTKLAKKRFSRPATADLAKEKRLHEVYLLNEKVLHEINEAEHRVKNKRLNRLWKYAAKSGVIKNLEDEFAFRQFDNNVFVNNEIMKSNQEIRKMHFSYVNKNREVEEELEKTRLAYEKKLRLDLLLEKSGYDDKNKLQLQLKALVDKYDNSLLEKYKEELMLQDEYEKSKKELDELLEVFKKEEAIYEEVVMKRLREDKRKQDAKVLHFTQMRAAIKIQRWWKKCLKAIKKRQKKVAQAKKGKGKDESPKGDKGAKGAKGAKGEKGKPPPANKGAKEKPKAKKK